MGKLTSFCTLLIAFSTILSVLVVYHQIPKYSGFIEINRDNYNTVTIARDQYAIPTVTGETFVDVAYGIGYAHAQDRLWTMHFKRRVCEGRISEIAGKDTTHLDVLFRQLKIDRNAKAKYENLSPEMKQVLTAYADGINDYVASLTMLPLEF